MVNCDFNAVRERDMDVLLAEAFSTDPEFLPYVLKKDCASINRKNAPLSFPNYKVSKVELWKSDNNGESDVTITISDGTSKVGLLIEDKIDAPAQKDQSARYIKRGQAQLGKNFEAFHAFIICPQKYYEQNEEAKLYPHYVSYEDIRDFFAKKTDPLSEFRHQQIVQAIKQAKKAAQVTLNEKANEFFIKYHSYVHEHYPLLDLRTSTTSNGYWPRFGTKFGGSYIYHKTDKNTVDYTFPNAGQFCTDLEHITELLHKLGNRNNFHCSVTGKSAALQLKVSELDVTKEFTAQESNLRDCLEAVQLFSNLADLLASGQRLLGC